MCHSIFVFRRSDSPSSIFSGAPILSLMEISWGLKINLHNHDTSLHFMHTQKVNINCLTELIQKQMAMWRIFSACWNPTEEAPSSRWARLSVLCSVPVQSIMVLGISYNYWESYHNFVKRSKLQSIVSFDSNIFTEILCLKRWQQSWGYSH